MPRKFWAITFQIKNLIGDLLSCLFFPNEVFGLLPALFAILSLSKWGLRKCNFSFNLYMFYICQFFLVSFLSLFSEVCWYVKLALRSIMTYDSRKKKKNLYSLANLWHVPCTINGFCPFQIRRYVPLHNDGLCPCTFGGMYSYILRRLVYLHLFVNVWYFLVTYMF